MDFVNIDQSRGIRPWFAATFFGLAAAALLFITYEGAVAAASNGAIAAWCKPYSFFCAALPFSYLAVRGFVRDRSDALADISQRFCATALVFFVLSALGIGFLAGWPTALGPGIAALISSLGVPAARRILLWA